MPTSNAPTPTLPRVFPLVEAARRMGVTEAALKNMIQSGQIPAFQAPDGQMLVPMTTEKPSASLPVAVADDDINARLAAIKREDFEELEGVPITVSEAARKYEIGKRTLQKWLSLYGEFIEILEPARGPIGAKLNEADIAYFATIHKTRKAYGVRSGVPLVDEAGKPNLLKHPLLSLYRHHKRQRQTTS